MNLHLRDSSTGNFFAKKTATQSMSLQVAVYEKVRISSLELYINLDLMSASLLKHDISWFNPGLILLFHLLTKCYQK